MTDQEWLHALTYINWRQEAENKRIKIAEADELLKKLKATGKKAKSKTKRIDWQEDNTWTLVKDGNWNSIGVRENSKLVRYSWHEIDDKKNEDTERLSGSKCASIFNEHFQIENGCTLRKAFGYVEKGGIISRCVPRGFFYINDFYKNVIIKDVSKADYSSNYPSNLLGKLPDANTAVEYPGEISPSSEYPFAFYDNGHCAEYQRFDTRDYPKYGELTEMLQYTDKDRCMPKYLGKATKTILCKASTYTLNNTVQHFYDLKQAGDTTAKAVLNTTIGMFHANLESTRDSYRLYHVAAVCIGRANQLMLDTVSKIGLDNVLQIVIDGILYIDQDNISLTKDKALGKLVLEVYKAKCKQIGINQYLMIDTTGNVVEKKASGFNSLSVETTKTFEDMRTWKRL